MSEEILEETLLRVRVHDIRVSIELIAANAFGTVTQSGLEQNNATARLAVLAHECATYSWAESYRIIRLARHCYKRTSDVMHGRSSMASVTSTIVNEWDQIAKDIEDLHRDWLHCHGSSTP